MFFFDKTILKPQQRFKSYLHKVYTEKVNKTALSSNDKNPENIRYDEDVLKRTLVFIFRRRLDQDDYICLTHMSSENVFIKTNIFVLVIRLQDVFNTFSRRPQDISKTLSRHVQGIFKTSSRCFENVFKKSSSRLQDV